MTVINSNPPTVSEEKECPNCKEIKEECACIRNICRVCRNPVGNITFTVCDECWDEPDPFREKGGEG